MAVKMLKAEVKRRMELYEPAKIKDNDEYFTELFDKKLSIVIPGIPITDSRPRASSSGYFYNPNKNKLNKLFKEIYKEDKLLQETFIDHPVGLVLKIYHKPKKKFERKLDKERLKNEEIVSVRRKDNDNFEKVHWDILEDKEYRILLTDRLVCKNVTEKFYTLDNPRIEIDILYNSKNKYLEGIYESDIKSTVKYRKFLLSETYLDTKDFSDKEYVEHFKEHVKYFSLSKVSTFMKFLKKNVNKDRLKILIKELSPHLLTTKEELNYKGFAEYVINNQGKFD